MSARVPETCLCLTYGHGLSLTFVVNSQCPFHGPRRDLSPMGGGPVPPWLHRPADQREEQR